jgi:hypothetical protein
MNAVPFRLSGTLGRAPKGHPHVDHQQQVMETAQALGLLDAEKRLVRLDSLMVIDLVVALEETTGLAIPADALREETFQSLESVTKMLLAVAASSGGA